MTCSFCQGYWSSKTLQLLTCTCSLFLCHWGKQHPCHCMTCCGGRTFRQHLKSIHSSCVCAAVPSRGSSKTSWCFRSFCSSAMANPETCHCRAWLAAVLKRCSKKNCDFQRRDYGIDGVAPSRQWQQPQNHICHSWLLLGKFSKPLSPRKVLPMCCTITCRLAISSNHDQLLSIVIQPVQTISRHFGTLSTVISHFFKII